MGVAMSVDTSAETVRTLIGTIQASSIHGPRWREQVRALEVAAAALLTERDEAIRQREAAEQERDGLIALVPTHREDDGTPRHRLLLNAYGRECYEAGEKAAEARAATLEARVQELEADLKSSKHVMVDYRSAR